MRAGLLRVVACVAAACGAMSAGPAWAADLTACTTADEARAFSLRHLQSRLMVAGLACNQREAYDNFVESFRPLLAHAGADFIGYFQRSGGGQSALNRHVTELANVAGLYRAEDPEGFCRQTWNTFLLLKDQPTALEAQAVSHMLKDAGSPALCAAPSVPAEAANVVKAAAEKPAHTVD